MILPCSASREENDVFWRRDGQTVYDIINGEGNTHDQDTAFKGRVGAFPSEFANRNYSIILRDVKLSDSGSYSCKIPNKNNVHVDLEVKGVYW